MCTGPNDRHRYNQTPTTITLETVNNQELQPDPRFGSVTSQLSLTRYLHVHPTDKHRFNQTRITITLETAKNGESQADPGLYPVIAKVCLSIVTQCVLRVILFRVE